MRACQREETPVPGAGNIHFAIFWGEAWDSPPFWLKFCVEQKWRQKDTGPFRHGVRCGGEICGFYGGRWGCLLQTANSESVGEHTCEQATLCKRMLAGALKPGWSASPKGSHGKRRITVCLLAYVKYEHSVSWLMAYVNNRYFPVRLVYPAGGFSSEAIARRCVAWFVAIA